MLARLRAARELPHLRAPSDLKPEDEAAFDAHAIALTADYAVLGASFMIVAIIVWWPIDWIVKPDARYLEAFARLRARGLLVELATLGLFLGSSRVRRASLVVGPILYAALLGAIGYSLGEMGGAELSWLADAIIGAMPAAVIPLRLGPRVAATMFIGLSLPAGFFLPFPENLRVSTAPGQVSFVVFSLLATILLGELLYRVLRRMFFQQRSLARARAGLAELNASLADRVAAQTRELRALAGHLERVQEAERRRISRDLHDELAQELTAMRYTVALLSERHDRRPEAVSALVADLTTMLEVTTATVRGFITELRPRVLDDLGLVAAAEWLCERIRASGEVACRLTVSDGFPDYEDGLDPELALTLFRVVQEATTNARKHARAGVIDISLEINSDAIEVEVRDDGAGYDPTAPSAGIAPGLGTRVIATVPSRIRQSSLWALSPERREQESTR
jgi:signal transduction histidine kinase